MAANLFYHNGAAFNGQGAQVVTAGDAGPVLGVSNSVGSHAYTYVNGLMATDTWTVGALSMTTTYSYTNGQLSGAVSTDWT